MSAVEIKLVFLKLLVLWAVTSYVLVGECWRFGGTCCLRLQSNVYSGTALQIQYVNKRFNLPANAEYEAVRRVRGSPTDDSSVYVHLLLVLGFGMLL